MLRGGGCEIEQQEKCPMPRENSRQLVEGKRLCGQGNTLSQIATKERRVIGQGAGEKKADKYGLGGMGGTCCLKKEGDINSVRARLRNQGPCSCS